MASMPFSIEKRRGFKYLGQPPLTQTLGPWIRHSDAKYAKKLGNEKDLMIELIDQLPSYDSFGQNWNYTCTNWLPFYWRGFNQTTFYTYVIEDLRDTEQIWDGIATKVRGDIRKARDRYGLVVSDDLDVEEFILLNNMVFSRQGRLPPYSPNLVRRLDAACRSQEARKIWVAEDSDGRKHAAIYVVWDESSAYYLMGGTDPEFRASGATSLLIWNAIKHAAAVTRKFDFEGSMLESVERFFRGFGATQTPYHKVTRTNSRLLQLKRSLGPLVAGILGRN